MTQPENVAPDGSTVLPPDTPEAQPEPPSGEQNAGYENDSTDGVPEFREKAAQG